MKIIEAASKLIKSDIKGVSANREIYPGSADMYSPQKGVELLPESLKLLLRDVFVGKCTDVNIAAVGQARKTVVRLGGFHTEMSFLGAIGYIMSDSGLHEILSVIYAEKAVNNMLSGKAISRALRGHGIVYMALQSLIVSEVFDCF